MSSFPPTLRLLKVSEQPPSIETRSKMNPRTVLASAASAFLALSLTACGGGSGNPTATTDYTIGGTVTGLSTSQQVVLNDNLNDMLTVTANGTFTFTTPVANNTSYAVTVGTQPTGQICTVARGSGSGVTANVATVSVICSTDTYTIGGSVSGLASGVQVTLDDNSADALTVTANGAFTFATPVTYNGS